MANMSYCRFENTWRDLQDCENNLAMPVNAKACRKSEYDARVQLVLTALSIIENLNCEDALNHVDNAKRKAAVETALLEHDMCEADCSDCEE